MTAGGRARGRILVLALPWTWIALFLMAPMAIILAIALALPEEGIPPFTLGLTAENLSLAVTDPFYRDALVRSLRTAALSTLACLVIGFPMALAIARAPETWRDGLLLVVMLPFWTGFLMRINAWIGLLADQGWINQVLGVAGIGPLRLIETDTALLIGIIYTYLPFMILPLTTRLTRLDPTLIEAAADLGAPPWQAFLRVTVPLALPGIAAGSALVFIPAVGEFVIPVLLGGPGEPLIGRVLWEEFFNNRNWPMAAALAVWLFVLLIALPAALLRLCRRPAAARSA